MLRKMVSVRGGVIALVLTIVVVTAQGCGSGNSGGSFLTACQNACNREAACADASSPATMSLCMSTCASANSMMNMQNCPNLATQVSMANACLAMPSCTGLENCLYAIPGCSGSNGSGGGNGSGGTSGMGTGGSTGAGGSGAADCSTCAQSHTCCLATDVLFGIPDGSGCDAYSQAQCNSMTGSAQTQYIATCSNELVAGQSLGVTGCQ
jgi:hypothetical protein